MGHGSTTADNTGNFMKMLERPHPAVSAASDTRMSYLDVHALEDAADAKLLVGKKIIIIGAGPSGLVLARNVARFGARVTVLEKAGDPRQDDPGYTDRSFNITIDNVGRQVLDDPRAWKGGIWIHGRAIHHFNGSIESRHSVYGETTDPKIVSIPRPVLRQNLCCLAEEAGVDVRFRSEVVAVDADNGKVTFISTDGRKHTISGDMVAFCDGLHSIANEMLRATHPEAISVWPEPRHFVTAMIDPCDSRGYSMGHISFWHEPTPDTYTVGIPNADGSIALLVVSPYADIPAHEHPFADVQIASRRLERDFPHLFAAFPQLADQLPQRPRGSFCYKTVKQHRIGARGVVVGDASIVFPPWAGYGANQGMYAAGSLAHAITAARGDFDRALDAFQSQQLQLTTGLVDFVVGQGDFLSGPVKNNPAARSQPALALLIKEVRDRVCVPAANQARSGGG